MANIAEFVSSLAPVIGMHPMTLQRYIDNLTDLGLIRKTNQGCSVGRVDLDHQDAAKIIFALASFVPRGAASSVRKLAALYCDGEIKREKSLLQRVAMTIYRRALSHITIHGTPAAFHKLDWKLIASTNSPYAKIGWNAGSSRCEADFNTLRLDSGVGKYIPKPAMQRATIIRYDVIDVVAQLVADTHRRAGWFDVSSEVAMLDALFGTREDDQ